MSSDEVGWARCSVIFLYGFIINLVLSIFIAVYYFDLLPPSFGADRSTQLDGYEQSEPGLDLSVLNVRLSGRAIHPPEALVKRTVLLEGIRGARPLLGEPTRAAILEDDARRRVLILSTDPRGAGDGPITAYLLHEFEIERHLPRLTACAEVRRCAYDRRPATGGLGCVAVCLVEALRE